MPALKVATGFRLADIEDSVVFICSKATLANNNRGTASMENLFEVEKGA